MNWIGWMPFYMAKYGNSKVDDTRLFICFVVFVALGIIAMLADRKMDE